jgi:hypothetical protein
MTCTLDRICKEAGLAVTMETVSSAGGGSVSGHVFLPNGNNPVKYTDPDGMVIHIAVFAALGAVAGGAVAAVVSIQAGNDIGDTLINVGVGMAGGAIAGVSLSVGQSAVAGAAIGAVSNVLIQRTTGSGKVDPAQVLIATGIGAAGGALGAAVGGSVTASAASLGASTVTSVEAGTLSTIVVTTMTAGLSGAVTASMDMNK